MSSVPAIHFGSPMSHVLRAGIAFYLAAVALGSVVIALLYYVLGASAVGTDPVGQSVGAGLFALVTLIVPGLFFGFGTLIALGLIARRRAISRGLAVMIALAVGLLWFVLLFVPTVALAGLGGTNPALALFVTPWLLFGLFVRDRIRRSPQAGLD